MTGCTLVTGCAGFIGSHVADALLAQGHHVVGLDDLSGGVRENLPAAVEFVEGSVCDPNVVQRIFRAHRIDYVFHLAAYAAEGLSHYIRRFNYENNVIGGVTLINEAVAAGTVRCFVFTSSIAVYGHVPAEAAEETPPAPIDPYGIAKLAVELDLAAANAMFGLPYIVFRPHNVYGERQNLWDPARNVIGIFMHQLLKGEPMTIIGDGEQSRAFTYIGDVAPVMASAVKRPELYNQIFNIGADEPCSILNLAALTAKALGLPMKVRHLPPRLEARHLCARHERLAGLGYRSQTTLDEGLTRMARWAREQRGRSSLAPPATEIDTRLALSARDVLIDE